MPLKDDDRAVSIIRITDKLSNFSPEFIRTIYTHIFNIFTNDTFVIEKLMVELDPDILVEMYNDLEFYDYQYLQELFESLISS